MSNADWIDVAAGILILLFIYLMFRFRLKAHDRMSVRRDNSVGEKYMKLMSTFIRGEGGSLIDMSENSADMQVKEDDGTVERLSIVQHANGVSIKWSLTNDSNVISREFEFTNNESQNQIMRAIASGITEAKSKNQS